MLVLKSKFQILSVVLCFVLTFTICGDTYSLDARPDIEILCQRTSIRVGEPLVIRLICRFNEPRIVPKEPDKVIETIPHEGLVEIFDSNGVKIKPYQRIFPSILRLMNAQGREYFCDFTLFYDHYSKKLLFDKPGTYTVSVIACETRCVPPLEVTVRPETDLTGEAPSLQLDPNAALFMELGLYENEKTRVEAMSKLMQMTKQYGGHPLAKWSAGRLGLEYYKNFLTKYPMFNQLSSEQRSVAIKDELFTQATTLLDKATSLPDEFPLREEVLYKLSSAEYMDGNHKRTASLLDELAAKYPYGEYGKRAASAKKELLGLAKQQKLTPSFWTRPSFLIIAAVGIGIVVISIIFLLKKKVTT